MGFIVNLVGSSRQVFSRALHLRKSIDLFRKQEAYIFQALTTVIFGLEVSAILDNEEPETPGEREENRIGSRAV